MLTNDDGIDSEGLHELYDFCKNKFETYIVTPAGDKSGKSHALTLYEPIFYRRVNNNKYIVEGMPTDCVKIALSRLFPDISLVISGINLGFNIGPNVFYSSTVAQCLEAFLYGKNSIALSLQRSRSPKYATVIKVLDRLLNYIAFKKLNNFCLSVNVPNIEYRLLKGIKVANHAAFIIRDNLVNGVSPKDKPYFWVKKDPILNRKKKLLIKDEKFPLDVDIVNDRYVSITPLKPVLFDEDKINELKDLEKW